MFKRFSAYDVVGVLGDVRCEVGDPLDFPGYKDKVQRPVDRLRVADSTVAATTFADAPMPAFASVPPMQIVLVDNGEAPTGAGETAIVAASAAIANALRAATGHRFTRFPVTPADVLAALRENLPPPG